MVRCRWLMVAAVVGGLLGPWRQAWAAGYAEQAGTHEVATIEVTWCDETRQREVPLRINWPKDLATIPASVPVIVFSHGLGGSRDSYADYGKQWASYGYVVLFPQHHGSDTPAVISGERTVFSLRDNLVSFKERVDDIHFVLDQVALLNAGKLAAKGEREQQEYAEFKGKLDLDKIGMAGHSFGAYTTLAMAGQRYAWLGKETNFADPRVKAALAMSPAPPKEGDLNKSFEAIKIPMFYLTGTKDSLLGVQAGDRRVPFDHATFPETYLLTLTGATHMTFVPREGLLKNEEKDRYQRFIRESTTAFWDAYLKGDAKAKTWLKEDFAKELGKVGVFERKGGK